MLAADKNCWGQAPPKPGMTNTGGASFTTEAFTHITYRVYRRGSIPRDSDSIQVWEWGWRRSGRCIIVIIFGKVIQRCILRWGPLMDQSRESKSPLSPIMDWTGVGCPLGILSAIHLFVASDLPDSAWGSVTLLFFSNWLLQVLVVWHVGSCSPTGDGTWKPCPGSSES